MSLLTGLLGALALNHVELDHKPEPELSQLPLTSVESHAQNSPPLKNATSTHAQLTVSSLNGQNGVNATRPAELVPEPEADLSSKLRCLEELNVVL